jgi:hypothetical protein
VAQFIEGHFPQRLRRVIAVAKIGMQAAHRCWSVGIVDVVGTCDHRRRSGDEERIRHGRDEVIGLTRRGAAA